VLYIICAEQENAANLLSDDAENAKAEYERNLPHIHGRHGSGTVGIVRIITLRHTTSDRLRMIEDQVLQYEDMHLIEVRWTSDSPEYIKASKLLSQRKYLKAVDELERLVIQCLMEMTKLGIAGTSV
jgi:hypothetical protein